MNKCFGCGVVLQNKDINGIGYTKNLDNKYCERCFRTIHYNEYKKVSNVDNNKIINKINDLQMLTIFVTDLLSINTNLISWFKKITNDKILVINKCDIIPDNLKLEHIEKNIQNSFKVTEDVFFISSKKDLYLDRIIDIINKYKKVIFCGETSSGKSTLINKILGTNLTTSKYSNTTLEFIPIKKEDYIIYDTPGLLINENKTNLENIKVYNKKLSSEFCLNIDGLKLKGNGNIIIFLDKKVDVISKKDDDKLTYKMDVKGNSDIELEKGFIYLKNSCIINSNREIIIRKSIIGK